MLSYILLSLFPGVLHEVTPIESPSINEVLLASSTIPDVPFYSQFADISSPKWKKVGCGITSLTMVVDYYKPQIATVNELLEQGLDEGAYIAGAGWSHQGLVRVSKNYGLNGQTYDLSGSTSKAAFTYFKDQLKDGPIIVSVHYKMDPKNPIPHLVVINGIDSDTLYYNDPAAKTAAKEISAPDFQKAWKKRFIVIRPEEKLADL